MNARQPRQSSSPGGGAGGESRGDCLFGSGVDVDLCDWGNVPFSAFEWLPSNGKDSFWIGGPRKDSNANNELGECLRGSGRICRIRESDGAYNAIDYAPLALGSIDAE